MNRTLTSLILGVALVASLSGCGAATPESIKKEQIAQLNEIATVLENAKSVDEAKPKVDAIVAKSSDLKKRADALKLSEAQQKELETLLKPEMEKAASRMMAAIFKLAMSDPQGLEKLQGSIEKVALDKK